MESSVLPVFVLCVLPLLGLSAAFALGRWTARYQIRLEPRQHQDAAPVVQTPYNWEGRQ
jgi:hypothetical protein